MKPTFHMPTKYQDRVYLKHGNYIEIETSLIEKLNTYSLY